MLAMATSGNCTNNNVMRLVTIFRVLHVYVLFTYVYIGRSF